VSQLSASVAIVGGRVIPVDRGPIEGGTVVITDGVITAVGPDVAAPEGMRRVDAAGRWVLPGFVDAHAHVGIDEEGQGWAGIDSNEKTDPNSARMRALDAINPADLGFQDALSGGVTSVVVKPGSGNPIGGQTVAIKTWGRIVDEMVIKSPASMKSALGENPKKVYGEKKELPSTRLGVASVIRDALVGAQDYRARREVAAARGDHFVRDPNFDALVDVLDGKLPWCQHAHRADDIATAIRLADEFGYKLIVNHATEGYLLADVLAQRNLPCIVGPMFSPRAKVELRERTLANPGRLANAGVQVALTTDHPVVPINFLVHQATLAVKEGMSPDDALRSITVNPAAMLGLDDRIGALRAGLDGDVVIWDGDPIDVMSRALQVFVNGVAVYEWRDGRGVTASPYRYET
jgi:imidazolonepropionase-like amidohydrolase